MSDAGGHVWRIREYPFGEYAVLRFAQGGLVQSRAGFRGRVSEKVVPWSLVERKPTLPPR